MVDESKFIRVYFDFRESFKIVSLNIFLQFWACFEEIQDEFKTEMLFFCSRFSLVTLIQDL